MLSFFSFFLLFSLSFQECSVSINNCEKCNYESTLCFKCEKNIYKPDKKGGCEPSRECKLGQNYCNECNMEQNLCKICETGFYPDKNGGCSITDNCEISYEGQCIQCIEDFTLVGNDAFKYCKSKLSDSLKNCKEINPLTGLCSQCKEGFFINSKDHKCIETEHCKESLFGVCTLCQEGYYLDKRDDSCKLWTSFFNCKVSINGEECDECLDDYYLTNNGKCSISNYCDKADKKSTCQKCLKGFYMTLNGHYCTRGKNCASGDKDFGICKSCKNSFYYNSEENECFSNEEDNEYKYCEIVKDNICTKCTYFYYLDEDSKCTPDKNCLKSENGICTKCKEKYHMNQNNICTNVTNLEIENCISFNEKGECEECENNYYYDNLRKKCFMSLNQFKNCKSTFDSERCHFCKKGYYLNQTDYLCYSNVKDNLYNKCGIVNQRGECVECENNYFLNVIDLKCSKIENCAISNNAEECIKCDDYYCLDFKEQKCVDNYASPENKDEEKYYACNITNDEGTECIECANEYFELENGKCINKGDCAEEEDGECIKCNEVSHDRIPVCLNKKFGCVETSSWHCLKCDNETDFDQCTKCEEGFELNDFNNCVEM